MISQISKIQNILFVDVETVVEYVKFCDAPKKVQKFWEQKSLRLYQEVFSAEESYVQKGAIFSEYAKVVCISCGYIALNENGGCELRLKSFCGDDEAHILESFLALVREHFSKRWHYYCGHNFREFDFPFLCRRAMIKGVRLPEKWHVFGKKPWEVNFIIDTLDMWKFGDYKKYISLDLMHYVLCGQGAKQDVDGSQVHRLYWQYRDFGRLEQYCEDDVRAVVHVFLVFWNSIKRTNIQV